MADQSNQQRFNDDILLNQTDRDLAAALYPSVAHVLDHPELRAVFAEYDEPANRAKRTGRLLGMVSIILVLAALICASLEPYLPHPHAQTAFIDRILDPGVIVAFVAAALGLTGAFIGSFGMLYATRKRRWLRQRLMTERLRQFHFQLLCARIAEIRKSLLNDEARQHFFDQRALWLNSIKARFGGKLAAEFESVVADEGDDGIWLHPAPARNHEEVYELEPLFDAYRELRIVHQLGYVNYKLSASGIRSLCGQQAIFATLTVVSIAFVCAIHAVIITMALFFPAAFSAAGAVLTLVSVWIAFAALALHAMEQGLQPERELERYQQYRSALRGILSRFDSASSQVEKLSVMNEMERVSYDEMRNFMITNIEARFVM